MKKKLLAVLLALVLIVSFLPVCAMAAQYGSCGDNLEWELSDDGVLTISGTGPMKDFSLTNQPWSREMGQITSVVLKNGVTSIGDFAFYRCRNLTSVKIPDSVISIGGFAFSECAGLTSLTIPDSVKSIGFGAFANCEGLTSLSIPGEVELEMQAFAGCTGLADSQGFVVVNHVLFAYAEDADRPVIPEGVTVIDGAVFSAKSMTGITLPDGVMAIGDGAFSECMNLTAITLPDSVTSIGARVFQLCGSLTAVVIPENVKHIGEHAFQGSHGLTGVTVGSKDVEFESDLIIDGDIILYGYSGSTTESYAESRGYTFVPISGYSVKDGAGYHTYPITSGDNATYRAKSGDSVTISATGLPDRFTGLLVDGQVVNAGDYQLAEGSTIVTISGAFLDTLSAGEHTVTLEFENGAAKTTVTIQGDQAPADKPGTGDNPATGNDIGLVVGLGLIMVLALCGVGTVAYGFKKQY